MSVWDEIFWGGPKTNINNDNSNTPVPNVWDDILWNHPITGKPKTAIKKRRPYPFRDYTYEDIKDYKYNNGDDPENDYDEWAGDIEDDDEYDEI